MSIGGIGPGGTPSSYSINDILKYTQPKQPSGFRRFLGALTGGVANMFIPGAGSVISKFISGGATKSALEGLPGEGVLAGDVTSPTATAAEETKLSYYLTEQLKWQSISREFEFKSTIAKARHDSCMSAIRNMK